MGDRLNISNEMKRKLIHLSTTLIPLLYISIIPNKEHIFLICVLLSIGFLLVDLLRMFSRITERYFLRIFSSLLREDEIDRQLTGATYLFIGLTLAVFLFPRDIAVIVMMFLSIADPDAAIFGKTLPMKTIFNKILGGFFAFLFCATIIVTTVNGISLIGLIVAFIAAIVELLPLKINDNISIPVISGYMFIFLR